MIRAMIVGMVIVDDRPKCGCDIRADVVEDKVEAVDEDEEKLVDGGGPNCEHKDDADDRMLEVADDT
ncbi:hypothetical protein QR98_0035900 [Sarcoptes scabiei]|uniref:Uncharacterized protein n=1 Tax=Sarcoptes scabiei TaxID=52283 RepID=A0A132A2G4_SARSC|nr:hypothetical protein QR98_0035900 [Sarcoptes scabiei]